MDTTERAKILDRLAAGEITAAEAMRLLDGSAQAAPAEPPKEQAWSVADDIPVEEMKAEAIKIEAPDNMPARQESAANGIVGEGGKPRWLKIRVRDRVSGHNKVSITLPIGFVSLCLGIARHLNADMRHQGTDELLAFLKAEQRGMLVQAEDEEDNEQVLIYLD